METSDSTLPREATIVVIDDDVGFSKSFRALLLSLRQGLILHFYEESKLALNDLEIKKADLIITDLQGDRIMPFQVFRQALQSTFNRETPVVRMSGDHNLRDLYGEGAIAFLPKPIDVNRLETVLSEVGSKG